ncbi:MAG: hypothetical protein NDJ90_15300 [Oligoflexia bacterium]|nr:hypothetical protein [Oligoflexia bacterium]
MKGFRWIIVAGFSVGSMHGALALDTVEPYSSGLSDYEMYVAGSEGAVGVSAAMGYGAGRFLNPSASISHVQEGSLGSRSLRLANASLIYQGDFEVDAIPAVEFSSDVTYSLGFEWTLPLGSVTPYLQHSHSAGFADADATVEHALTGGALYSGLPGFELFGQLSRSLGSAGSWSPAVGANWKVSGAIELIADVAYDAGVSASIGTIFTWE